MKKAVLLLVAATLCCPTLQAQIEEVVLRDGTKVKVDRSVFPDLDLNRYAGTPPADYTARRKARAEGREAAIQLPPCVNNGENKYFPPIFNQDGGSCGSAQNIGYMFTHEINSWRDLDASLPENQYPSHFTWLMTNSNSGKEEMAMANGIPSVVTYGGRTYSRLFGNQTCDDSDFGWMQGYDKWYSAMWNRASGFFSMSATNTPEGRRELKEWLYNHGGDESMHSGGIVGIGLAAYGTWAVIPATEANKAAGVNGMKYVKSWGDVYNHAVTICGYDDRIEFDLDGDGQIGEVDEDEVGAWIIANSWGDGWENKGFIYCPYKYSYSIGTNTMAWSPGSYYIRRDYRPLRTIKLTMDYSHRSEVLLCAGVAANLDAKAPERTVNFEHFRYAGNGGNVSPDPAVPMLGRWTDGMHYEPMELGYDLTDLTAGFDRTRPLKYFFQVKTKSTAQGTGHILSASIINYETDEHGIEIPFEQQDVDIQNGGKVTTITCIVPGEQIYPPTNLELTDGVLGWRAPLPSGLSLMGYNVYEGTRLVASLPKEKTYYTPQADVLDAFTVKAVYQSGKYRIESDATNSVAMCAPEQDGNQVLKMDESGFTIPSVVTENLSEATIEFWLKPTRNANYLQQVGPGWGRFLFHTDSSGALYAGWNTSTGDRMQVSGVFKTNIWAHVAIVVKDNQMTAYVNGVQKGRITSNNYSGLVAFGELPFGRGGSDTWWQGSIDEVRIWKVARTQTELKSSMRVPIARPSDYPDLIAYLPMDVITVDGHTFLRDWAGGHHARIQRCGTYSLVESQAPFNGASVTSKLSIEVLGQNHVCGAPVTLKASNSLNATSWTWTVPDASPMECVGVSPVLTFDHAGTFPITCKATFTDGTTLEANTTIEVHEGEAPKAEIYIPQDVLSAGDRFQLINRTQGEGCSFKWEMPGAEVQESTATNVSVLYPRTGTFEVTLTATNRYGTSTAKHSVVVRDAAPMSLFALSRSVMVLGDTVQLTDQSRYSPETWDWQLSNGSRALLVQGQSPMIVPSAPGIYDVSLTTSNALGSHTATLKRILTVSNRDAREALNFTGTEHLELDCPFDAAQRALTLEWWMCPKVLEESVSISSESASLHTTVSVKGALEISLAGKQAVSDDGYIIANEWHHYAITYSAGTVKFYRDTQLVNASSTRLASTIPALGLIVVGGANGGFKGQMDEVRLWMSSLTLNGLRKYANVDIQDVAAAASEAKLLLYYDFNQNGGDVQDRCPGGHNARRVNFGPDGDAWGSAEGVFTLDTESPTFGDCSARFLTNYKNAFITAAGTVNPNNSSRFLKLAMNTTNSRWRDLNAVVNGSIITGAHIDKDHHGDITFETMWSGFADELKDYRLWQPVTLPAGTYHLGVTFGDGTDYTDSRLVVCKGATMVSNARCETDAIAWSNLGNGQLDFSLSEEQEVSIGIIVNMQGQKSFGIHAFSLDGMVYEHLAPLSPTGIITPEQGRESSLMGDRVYDLQGRRVLRPTARGIYIINDRKVVR